MRILYVDDEQHAVKLFERTLNRIETDGQPMELKSFSEVEGALDYAGRNPVDIAFLDIEMPGMSGLEMAEHLHKIRPATLIVFVTAHDQYALKAFDVDAMGYLLKPYTREDLSHVLGRLRPFVRSEARRVFFRTMPRFDVFVDGKLLPISSPKPKELLALLVDLGGGSLTAARAISVLWSERPNDEGARALYRMTLKRLREILSAAGIEFVLGSEGSQRFVNRDKVACDYYDFLRDRGRGRQRYGGEYMSEYAWAEETNARLSEIAQGRQLEKSLEER